MTAEPTPERPSPADPIPMRLPCPACGALHVDVGEFATKPHHTHACQECGMVWRPAVVCTVGVEFLPGFRNVPDPPADLAPLIDRLASAASWVGTEGSDDAADAASDMRTAADVLAAQQADLARKDARITELTDGIRAHRHTFRNVRVQDDGADKALWALLGEDPT